MSGFGPSSTSAKRTAADPTKHVNYVLGMVLGVDDFIQDFAYLAERDRWQARDLLGYGTAWGLAVTTGLGARGPEVRVSPGTALSPRGQLLRVTPAQCASLNDWLKAQGTAITPNEDEAVRVWVVLSYRECLTDPVPVPGEPCRSEDDAMAPSRVTDDFKLELRLTPPQEPTEEQAVRDLVRWLRTHVVPVGDDTPAGDVTSEADFLTALRAAVVPPSPMGPETDWLDDAAAPMKVPATQVEGHLRAALRVWVTELRALWRPNWLGEAQGCQQPVSAEPDSDVDCVLLAAVDVHVVKELGSPDWVVKTEAPLPVIEDERPYLLHLRLLQEWALAGPLQDTSAVHHPPALPAYQIVAAGTLPIAAFGNTNVQGYNNLRIDKVAKGFARLTFDGYQYKPEAWQYVVKVGLQEAEGLGLAMPTVTVLAQDSDGIQIRLREKQDPMAEATMASMAVIVEVSQYFAGAPAVKSLRAPPPPSRAPSRARRSGGGR
ncbi:hypothetical protein [Corallococcus llansteffanensis]|uniref:Uncharacterized protein n=1 Tax=Corallococcus llansteffanensis TaxID=2316731 RepID=A0A3A8PQF1_9BACT|nr:hypothetical protein [Corallococcus llansteffanensis]RKH58489.1 hypothetical protein D7V93_16655 [Corallococcus llansteffanensis]